MASIKVARLGIPGLGRYGLQTGKRLRKKGSPINNLKNVSDF